MDLPTCPSCGQSVLDDDATDCPFCGAAMDGSSPAKKPKGSAPKADPTMQKAAQAKAEEDDNDPFAIKQAPTGKKVIPCARKPMKGRLHRVVCPMCDTQGFIPKRAVGHQVKCANPECLVPVFMASGPESDDRPKAPARVSDEEVSKSVDTSSQNAAEKSPLVLYGVVGAVLLAATLGLVYYLNQPAPDSLGPANLPDFPTVDDDEPDNEVTPEPDRDEPPVPAGPDYQKQSVALVESMIDAARVTNGNRDKPYCRRLTADAWLRLGNSEKAEAEFQQMQVVAAQDGSNRDYFKIGPLITAYWRAVRANDQGAAASALEQAAELSEQIPDSRSDVALRSGISLAAALVNAGRSEQAVTLIDRLQGDVTVDDQQDSVRYGAWTSTAQTLRDAERTALSPLRVFAWHRPLTTAVGLELAVHEQWNSAVQWAATQQDQLAASDTFATIAAEAGRATAADRQKLASAAEGRGSATALRTWSSLALVDGQWLAKATEGFAALPQPEEKRLGTFAEIIKITTPDLSQSLLTGNAVADYITAELAARKSNADIGKSITHLYATMMAAVPPTPGIRRACGDIGRNDVRLKKQLAEELKLSDESRIRTQFNSYRRGMDRLARAAEERRLALLQMLARIVSQGGTDVVREALARKDGGLREEILVDHLSGLLFTAAVASGQDLPEAAEISQSSVVPIARVTPLNELAAVNGLVKAWKAFQAGNAVEALTQLEGVPKLTGLCSATANFMVEMATQKSASSAEDIAVVKKLRNEVWQEQAYQVIGRHAVRKDQFDSARAAIREASVKPAGLVTFLHGLVCGAIEKMSAEPSTEDG